MSDGSPPRWPDLTGDDGAALARYAAGVIARRLGGDGVIARRLSDDGGDGEDGASAPELTGRAALHRIGASFVTLERAGTLRGCVGTLDARFPLYRDVARNAVRAMADPRLSPVRPAEWPDLDVSVSVLGPFEPLPVDGWADLCATVRPGVDGLVIYADGRRATFLPTVWRRVPTPDRFLAALLAKGGWPAEELPAGAVVCRYTAASFHDRAADRGRMSGCIH